MSTTSHQPHSSTPGAEDRIDLLLIDDDPSDVLLVEKMLAESGMDAEINVASDLATARRAMTRRTQCIIVDLSAPGIDRIEGLRQVLAFCGSAAVVVLTGIDDAHLGVRAVAAGAEDYLVKQEVVDGRLLARAIRYAIERKRADVAQRELVEARLLRQENARLERALLPVPLLGDVDLTHRTTYLPGRQGLLAGDFLDTVQTPDGSVHVVIGDVCGHGPDEAALGAALRIAWRTLVLSGHTGTGLLRTLDAMLRHERKSAEIFTTLCTATIAPGLGHARMHIVGHPPPVLLGGGEARLVAQAPSGPPLGIFPEADWSTLELALGDEWALLFYTDGLIEATVGGGHEMLDTEGLLRLIEERGEIDLDHLVSTVQELHQDILADDVAAMLLARKGPP